MANPKALRTGLANRLKKIQGLTVYERWPNQINAPCAIIDFIFAEPEQTMGRGELTRYDFDINVLYPLAGGWENAQDQLDPLLATSSTGGVFGAIAGDRKLGGAAHTCMVKRLPGAYDRRVIDEALELLGVTVAVEVWAS